jgi:hypothetical protein
MCQIFPAQYYSSVAESRLVNKWSDLKKLFLMLNFAIWLLFKNLKVIERCFKKNSNPFSLKSPSKTKTLDAPKVINV